MILNLRKLDNIKVAGIGGMSSELVKPLEWSQDSLKHCFLTISQKGLYWKKYLQIVVTCARA